MQLQRDTDKESFVSLSKLLGHLGCLFWINNCNGKKSQEQKAKDLHSDWIYTQRHEKLIDIIDTASL